MIDNSPERFRAPHSPNEEEYPERSSQYNLSNQAEHLDQSNQPNPSNRAKHADQPTRFPDLTFNEQGLIPCIVQDADTLQVLMMAWMNRESLELTLQQRSLWFWSRSRKELWHKGATSGNLQDLVELRYDCDADTLLALVHPHGPACHTGATSCFYRRLD